jgi:hypothetical protein
MKTYNPNIRWAKHTVEITYQMWDYTAQAIVEVHGNTRGASILDSAIALHADELFQKQGKYPLFYLTRPAKVAGEVDELQMTVGEDSGDDIEEELKQMCVGLRIIGHELVPYEDR